MRGLGDGARVKGTTPIAHRGVPPRSRSQGKRALAWKGIIPSNLARSRVAPEVNRAGLSNLLESHSQDKLTQLNKPAPESLQRSIEIVAHKSLVCRRNLSRARLECCFRDEGKEEELWNMRSMTSEKKLGTPREQSQVPR